MNADDVIGATLVMTGAPVLVTGAAVYVWQAGRNARRYVVTTRDVRAVRRHARRARRAALDAMLARQDLIGSPHDGFRLDREIARGAMLATADDVVGAYRTRRETNGR